MTRDRHFNPPPRLVPELPLPPYSYVTRRFPHPMRDPAGHSYGQPGDDPSPLDPEAWQQSRTFRFACDLFNYGYYWEAHETWEALWNACGRRGTTADFLKGLIKLAAAGVKLREGRPAGARRHGRRAAELFRDVREVTGDRRYAGLDLDPLIAFADGLAQGTIAPRPDEPQAEGVELGVEILFETVLVPLD
jgi:uncharacterized protein